MWWVMRNFDFIIHHGPCYDGFTAAWVARRAFPDAEFYQATHGDPAQKLIDALPDRQLRPVFALLRALAYLAGAVFLLSTLVGLMVMVWAWMAEQVR